MLLRQAIGMGASHPPGQCHHQVAGVLLVPGGVLASVHGNIAASSSVVTS